MLRGVVDSGLPLVLKPRRATSSQDTELISDEEQLRAAVAVSEPGRMLLEGYIPDPTTPQTGAGSALYVSVALIRSSGMVDLLGISSRTPPSRLPFGRRASCYQLTERSRWRPTWPRRPCKLCRRSASRSGLSTWSSSARMTAP